jgi:hypothetical protein
MYFCPGKYVLEEGSDFPSSSNIISGRDDAVGLMVQAISSAKAAATAR